MPSTFTILVVGPETELRGVIVTILTSAGHTIFLTDNPCGAIDLPGLRQPDLILTDVELPGWDGAALVQTLRSGRRSDTPVFVLSAGHSSETRSRMAEAGANGWISAPVSPEILLAAVEAAAGGARLYAPPRTRFAGALSAGRHRYSYVYPDS
ncbi:DNA-binding response OmpR family regulator [Brevundimonas alba]|uniref:DNA-binding response OmpR family regulator n=1 Tax=Brevundimonas alba TaxID=74314 RepID=A0A7X5YHJ8_9CAUL|nr:response regulator [Brevundimonas alba]NJC39824.1 DNA-binding response OmpR family regulator [Brevundimonas alba]